MSTPAQACLASHFKLPGSTQVRDYFALLCFFFLFVPDGDVLVSYDWCQGLLFLSSEDGGGWFFISRSGWPLTIGILPLCLPTCCFWWLTLLLWCYLPPVSVRELLQSSVPWQEHPSLVGWALCWTRFSPTCGQLRAVWGENFRP